MEVDPREWHGWTPKRTEGANEADDWAEFVTWCDKWARFTNRVPILTRDEAARLDAQQRPDWYLRVYGGSR